MNEISSPQAGGCTWIAVDDERKPPPGKVVIFWVYAERHGEDDDGLSLVHDVSGIHTGEWRVTEHGSYFDCHSSPFADVEGVTHWMDPAAPGAAAAAPADDLVPVELLGVRETVAEGDGFWVSCSGCYETDEGYTRPGSYFSPIFKCHLGNGCSECGGIGAIWDTTDYDAMAEHMAKSPDVPAITWPKARDVGRLGDMSPDAHIRVGLDSDNDVFVSVWDGQRGGSVEFCNGGGGGGQSMRTRLALIALMVAIEADNAEKPRFDWWAARNGQQGAKA